MSCNHVWKMYAGLTESFEYCGNCDVKKTDAESMEIKVEKFMEFRQGYVSPNPPSLTVEEMLSEGMTLHALTGRRPTEVYISIAEFYELARSLNRYNTAVAIPIGRPITLYTAYGPLTVYPSSLKNVDWLWV